LDLLAQLRQRVINVKGLPWREAARRVRQQPA